MPTNLESDQIISSNKREQDSATRKVEDKTGEKPKIPEAAEGLPMMEDEKLLFPEIKLPSGFYGPGLFNEDRIEATIHEQLQLLYRRGEISFDPDKPQDRLTALFSFHQLKTLVINVIRECEKQFEEELDNDDNFQDFQEVNMPKLEYPRGNRNV